MGAIKERLQLPIENVMAYIQAEPHDQVVVELIWEAVKESRPRSAITRSSIGTGLLRNPWACKAVVFGSNQAQV